jgi:exopolyphosphatase/guanosine-5'-triphosphate,3'-diphosphate pyrophosphatase
MISEHAARNCIEAIKEILELSAAHRAEIRAIGTEALRVAPNSLKLLEQVRRETGLHIEVISEEQEAELTLKAVQADLPDAYFVCINGGGGSTELGWHLPEGDKFHVFNFGAKTLTDSYIKNAPNLRSAAGAIRKLIGDEMDEADKTGLADIKHVVAIGGSIWAAARLIKQLPQEEFDQLNGATITVEELERLAGQLIDDPSRIAQSAYAPGKSRLDVMLAGILVPLCISRELNRDHIRISTRSIADAVLLECCPQ